MATFPPATIEVPTNAAVMIVGPITVETELEGPIKLRPAPTHDWFAFPPVRPWPSVVEVTHAPAGRLTGIDGALNVGQWNPAKPVGIENVPVGAVLAPATGAPTASVAAAASAATRGVRRSIMVFGVLFVWVGGFYMLAAALTLAR
jgi:hypothetical protein